LFTVLLCRPEGLLIFAFRPLSGKKKIKQILCVLGVSAVKISLKTASKETHIDMLIKGIVDNFIG